MRLSSEQEAALTLVNAAHKEGREPKNSTSLYCLLLKAYEDLIGTEDRLHQKMERLEHHRQRVRAELLEVCQARCPTGRCGTVHGGETLRAAGQSVRRPCAGSCRGKTAGCE